MRKTSKLLSALLGTILAGQVSGCAPDQTVQQPSPPPHVEGYDDRYWEWDEEDQEWEYDPPGSSGGARWFYYGGMLHRSSFRNNPSFTSGSAGKSSFTSKLGGFGSGSKGGFFGG